MMIQQGFWEFRFIDILNLFSGIIGTIIAVVFTYYLYKSLEKYKEKRRVKALFLRMKDIFEHLATSDQEKTRMISGDLPYLRYQREDLFKIGVIIDKVDERRIKGQFKNNNINLDIGITRPIIWILDRYLFAGAELQNLLTNQKIDKTKENANIILKEMSDFAKEYYGIKLNDKKLFFS